MRALIQAIAAFDRTLTGPEQVDALRFLAAGALLELSGMGAAPLPASANGTQVTGAAVERFRHEVGHVIDTASAWCGVSLSSGLIDRALGVRL